MKQIAFLGLGVMGSHMAANLAHSGESVKAWNRTSDSQGVKTAENSGVTIVPSLSEAVKNAEIIFTCLGDVPDVEAVILGAGGVAEFAQKNALIVDTSTIGADAARKIVTELNKQNLRFLDAPISGGDIGAKNGTLTFMVGGSESDFVECKPFFEIMGKTIILCGEVGSGQAVKMCNQILCALNMVGLCEAMQLAEKQGIDPNLVVEVCSTGAAGSWALSNLGPKIIESDYQPGFAIKHIIKDLRLVLDAVAKSEADLPGTKLADGLFKTVKEFDNNLGSEQGTQAMIRAYKGK